MEPSTDLKNYGAARFSSTVLCITTALLVFEKTVWWGLVTVPLVLLACTSIRRRDNRILLLSSYLIVAVVSLLIGWRYERGGQISDDGLSMLMVLVPVVLFTPLRLLAADAEDAA